MITKELAALMALRVYEQGVDNPDNFPIFPYQGWIKVEPNPLPAIDGFAYGVFKNTTTNEIVISYRGTDGAVGMMGADGANNFGLAVGQLTSQATQAAKVYTKVLQLYGSDAAGSNISFTGHSLGGGLAGVMSVWFNRPAIVFDPAPFQLTALVPGTVNDIINILGGTTPVALLNYQTDIIGTFATREASVDSNFTAGEFLAFTRSAANTIYGTNTPYTFGNQDGAVSPFTLHSQALLVAGILSPDFRAATVTVQRSLAIVMSGTFYSADPDGSTQRNFVLDLIRSEQSAVAGQGKLTHFSEDLNKLGTNVAGLNAKAQDALIAQGVEWYYLQSTNYAGQNFFINNGQAGLLQYTSAVGAALPGALNKASTYTQAWLSEVYTANGGAVGTTFPPFGTLHDQWNIATSSTGVTASARDANKSQIYIGQAGADTFTAGNAGDVILAGAGADTLTSGNGYDLLYGGAGADRYNFNSGFGSDKILDADASGSIWVDGIELTGGKLLSADLANVWESADHKYRYTQMGGNLVISKGADAGTAMNGSITVQGWTQANSLGITLDNAPPSSTPPTGTLFFNGDQRAPINGSGNYDWAATSWATDGTLTGGVAEANFNDVISSAAAGTNGSVIHGYGGADALSGSSGKDDIYGDDGNDIIGGGAGSDNIKGGAGDDFIFSAQSLNVPQRVNPADSWSAPAGSTALAQGSNWGAYIQGDTFIWSGQAGVDDAPDVIDAGAGDDRVYAGLGADYIEGGLGKDNIQGGGGGDIIANTPYSIASYAFNLGVTARFDCENRRCKAQKRQFQRCMGRSSAKTAYAHSARLAGQKGLGGRIDVGLATSSMDFRRSEVERSR